MKSDAEKAENGDILSSKEIAFVTCYVMTLNRSKSAIAAGGSPKNAVKLGYDIYHRSHVKAEIRRILEARKFLAEENLESIRQIAESNLADYFKPVTRWETPQIKKGLSMLIRELKAQIDFEVEFMSLAELNKKDEEAIIKKLEDWKTQILRYKLEMKRNPKAFRIVPGKPEEVTEYVLDLEAVIKDKERGRIRSYKVTKDGVQVEFYNALDAKQLLAKLNGDFEKHNKQQIPEVPPEPTQLVFNLVPPLANDITD